MKMQIVRITNMNIKSGDYIIILILIVLSFIPIFVNDILEKYKQEAIFAIVRINGEEVDRFELNQIENYEKKYYPTAHQYNIIQIKDGRIRVKEDNSPDQIAVKTGWITRAGQTSICLPHRLVIEIQQTNSDQSIIK